MPIAKPWEWDFTNKRKFKLTTKQLRRMFSPRREPLGALGSRLRPLESSRRVDSFLSEGSWWATPRAPGGVRGGSRTSGGTPHLHNGLFSARCTEDFDHEELDSFGEDNDEWIEEVHLIGELRML